jgi:chromate transporter
VGPVVQTVAGVGYAAAGLGGGLLAALVAFAPSLAFVLLGAQRFDSLRANTNAKAFFNGVGPASIGAILGTAIPLTRALSGAWQYAILAGAFVVLFVVRWGVVRTLLLAAAAGAVVALAGAQLAQ